MTKRNTERQQRTNNTEQLNIFRSQKGHDADADTDRVTDQDEGRDIDERVGEKITEKH